MSSITFQRTYLLGDGYENIKERTLDVLDKYRGYENLIIFKESEKSVTFTTEQLIPTTSTNRPRVLFLFSNPHPHSVHQGMFLSPNTIGRENFFWPVMEKAGWLPIPKGKRTPKQLAEICVQANYQGPFELIFYCYYAFPTDYPEDIRKIFGNLYFSQVIEPESDAEFRKTIQDTYVDAVVTFNKGIFNLVSKNPIKRYIDRLKAGELIMSQIKGIEKQIPIFLTFPTGWHYHKEFMNLRKASLDTITVAIQSAPKSIE